MRVGIGGLAIVLLCAGCAGKSGVSDSARYEERVMVVTAYCDCKKCTSWKRNWRFQPVFSTGPNKGKPKQVGKTASGAMARKGTIAADSRYPFGTRMYIPGYGWGTVQDRGGAIKGDRLDLFFKSHKAAVRWGRKTLPVRIYEP